MKLSEAYAETIGDVDTDPELADRFLTWMFDANDVVGIRERKGMSWRTVAFRRDLLLKHLPDVLNGLYEAETEAYFCVSPLKVERAPTREGIKKGDNKAPHVLYADIDVKPGSFGSTEEALAWINSLEVSPGCVVESGSAGLHAYWLTAEPLSQERWWAYLVSTLPEGVSIDRLLDQTRVLRLPGSIRFMSNGRQVLVRAEFRDSEVLEADEFNRLTEKPYKALQADRKRRQGESQKVTQSLLGTGWKALVAEDRINQEMSWADILEPHGWTLHRDCGDHLQWTRPGKTGEKSATTGFPEEESAMSLFSEAPETRLDDLLDAKVRLSKLRVWLRLEHNDDVNGVEL